MSNPGVIILADVSTSIGNFRVEDNIGEAIHLHIGEFRYDLSVREFKVLAKDIAKTVEQYMKDVPGFDLSTISREFFLQKAECWADLVKVEKEMVMLENLQIDTVNAFGISNLKCLPYSRVIKALRGNSKENDTRKERNYYGQSNQQRVEDMMTSIKKNGYPFNNQLIVVFNNQLVIKDGQHRAACLYYLYGNKEVPVQRMFFKNGKYNERSSSLFSRVFMWNKDKVKRHAKSAYYTLVKGINNMRKKLSVVCIWLDKHMYRNS